MSHHVHQVPDLVNTFYVAHVTGSSYIQYPVKVEDNGDIEIPDGVYYASDLFSVVKERLERFSEAVVLLEAPVLFNRIASTQFNAKTSALSDGVLLTPKQYKQLLREWEDFRLFGIIPKTTPPFLHRFMSYCSYSYGAFTYLTRSEYEQFCQINEIQATSIKKDNQIINMAKCSQAIAVGFVDNELKIQATAYHKTSVDKKFRITRDQYPDHFGYIQKDIQIMECIVRSDFSIRVNFLNMYGDSVTEIFDPKPFGIPMSFQDILDVIKARAEPKAAMPVVTTSPVTPDTPPTEKDEW